MLLAHKQPELAETFFNSVITKMLHRAYYHNDFIFVRPALSTEYIPTDEAIPTYRSYYAYSCLKDEIRQIVTDVDWKRDFANLESDIDCLLRMVKRHLGDLPHREVNFQIQVLSSPFYRNKAAYIIGKYINGQNEYPFAVPVLHDADSKLTLDTILLEPWRISLLFSLSRAYFMVDMEVSSAYVKFLRSICLLYTSRCV